MTIVTLALVAQVLLTPVPAHVQGDLLWTANSTYQVTWGHNCGAIPLDGDVLMWPVDGVADQVAMAPMDADGDVATLVATSDATVASQMCSALLHVDAEGG